MFGFYMNATPGGPGNQCDGSSRGEGHGHGHGHRHGPRGREGFGSQGAGDGRSRCGPEASFGPPGAGRRGAGGRGGRGGSGLGPGGPGGRASRMFDPGALRLVVLDLIQESSRHGYDIIKALEERVGGMYSPSPGVIYPILSMYEDMGYITSTPEGNKKLYSVTDEGRTYLAQHSAHIAQIHTQIDAAGQGRNEGEIRQAMHGLRAVLVERLRHGQLDAAQLVRMKEILKTAQDEIQKL